MSNATSLTPVMVERAAEQLRQERETFDQQKKQEHLWFILRLSMGFASIVLLGAIMIVSAYILFKNADFPKDVVTAAGAALFVDVLGLLIGVWKIVLSPQSTAKLRPISSSSIPTVKN
ncbi:hypothetical protein [Duganella sp. Dugasp56]|uniref:hypothetical protein n=1 Tax=Duganella sp. Dugasp56 TaxID=3243046 RepID=UPI0039B102FF